jgi:tripartite-type tricarboxylate transporter receptor subunit TctC
MRSTKGFIAAVLFAATSMLAPSDALANDYPSRPIRLLHGFAAGGAADTLSRIIADGLSKRLGQPIVVEAKPGAGGNIAADAVAKATPDGYTIGLVTGAHAISAATYQSLSYQPAESFDMISTVVYYALVIAVRNDYPAKTLGELIAKAKEKPGSLSFGSVGFGSTHHLAGELLKSLADIDITHVPYRGDSQTVTALLGGEVPIIIGTPVLITSQIQSGTMRGLAVTGTSRIKSLPDVPTVEEAGVKGYDVRTWAGLLAPKGTPPDIINSLNAATLDLLKDPDIRQRLETATGGDVGGGTPEEMKRLIQAEIGKWTGVVARAKLPRI